MHKPLVVLLALASCTGELPGDTSELELEIAATSVKSFATYRINVSQAIDGKALLERKLDASPGAPSRFVGRFPAQRPLLVDVVAFDDNSAEVGGGAAIVELSSTQVTKIKIDIVAFGPGGSSGLLDISLAGTELPTQDYLTADPIENSPGNTQKLSGKSTSLTGIVMPIDIRVLDLTSAVVPMFSTEPDGGVTTTWVWPTANVPTMSARLAYLDAGGRGWIASATAKLEPDQVTAPVDIDWAGAVLQSGRLANQAEWHLGLVEIKMPPVMEVVLYADANGDGGYGSNEKFALPVKANGKIVLWTAPTPVGIVMPAEIAGAIADTDGNGTLDRIVSLGADGTVASTPWPLE